MKKVGLTGGIGAGKSFVAKIFAFIGVPVFYADLAAKYIMVYDPKVKKAISELLGPESYNEEGKLNKKHVGAQIFGNDDLRLELNKIVHPAVFKAAGNWFSWQKAPYAIEESALIFEVSNDDYFDHIISVSAPEKMRIERVMNRDKITAEQVKARLKKQWDQKKKDEKSDFVIYNDGSQSLLKQVFEIHQKLSSDK